MSREVVLKPIDATPEQIAQALFGKCRPKPEARQEPEQAKGGTLNKNDAKDGDE